MKNKSTLLLVGVFIAVIAGATMLYTSLSENVALPSTNSLPPALASSSQSEEMDSSKMSSSEEIVSSEMTDDSSLASSDVGSSSEITSTASETVSSSEEVASSEESAESDEGQTARSAAIDITFNDYNGNEVNLSDFYGKPIVLNFWASWCPPCRDEMPDFQEVYNEMGDDVQFIMLNATDGSRETVDDGNNFILENEFTFPVYYDEGQLGVYTYGVSSLPSTLFIDENGNIAYGHVGGMDKDLLLRYIEATKVV